MAEHLKLEELMIFALKRDFKPENAENYISRYFALKNKLYKDLLDWIRANEPMLSDHGPAHIDNVLNNAYKLLEKEINSLHDKDGNKAQLKGIDLFLLCTSILFHDVGNFFKREYHNLNIDKVIQDLFSQFFYGDNKREKQHIITIGKAHTGKGEDGGSNPLKDVPESDHSAGEEIKLRSIASIVRLADELAEGPQRTCQYMSMMGKITPESEIYHRYADCTHIMIDANNGRINLAYEIEINVMENQNFSQNDRENLQSLLGLIYKRIFKLDQERKYCGYYCDILKSIKETQVSFRFYNKGILVDFKLNPLVLTDLTVPGDEAKSIIEGRGDLEINAVIDNLDKALSSMSFQPKKSPEKTENITVLPDRKYSWFAKLVGIKK